MKKLELFMEKYLLPIATKVQGNKYISSVSDGFSLVLPIIMMGAIFTLLTNLQIDVYQSFVEATKLKVIFGYASKVTTDLLAVYVTAAIAFQLTKKKGRQDDSMIVAFVTLVMFLILIPFGVSGKGAQSGELVEVAAAISTRFLGAQGLFMAIIVAFIVPTIYCAILNRGWVIKLPESVPTTISKSFSSLIPAFITLFIFSLIRYGFAATSYADANSFLYAIIGQPLNALGNSPISIIVFVLVCQILWFFGLHGFMVILPFVQTIFLPMSLENMAAYEAGKELTNMITYNHFGTYVLLGGSGALLGLTILMAFFGKSKQYKTLGRLGLPSVFCGINEPIIFGLPLVLNTFMIIPFIVGPIIMFVIPYVCQLIGILPTLRGITMPLGTPAILYGWIAGGMPVMIMQIVLIFVQIALWFPFFKMADKKAFALETEQEGTV
ncbi:MAG: PTS transporter subunit EIIC [Coprobacillus sp.]